MFSISTRQTTFESPIFPHHDAFGEKSLFIHPMFSTGTEVKATNCLPICPTVGASCCAHSLSPVSRMAGRGRSLSYEMPSLARSSYFTKLAGWKKTMQAQSNGKTGALTAQFCGKYLNGRELRDRNATNWGAYCIIVCVDEILIAFELVFMCASAIWHYLQLLREATGMVGHQEGVPCQGQAGSS